MRGLRLMPVWAMAVAGVCLGERPAVAQTDSIAAQITLARTILAKYKDPLAAVQDGYFSTVACMDYPNGGTPGEMSFKPGAMGVHFLNVGFVGQMLGPSKPQVLIYEPNGDKLELVAAEWFVPVTPDVTTAPTIFGHMLQGPMEGHAPIMPNGLHHWDLHVWLWKDNPNGMFSPTNPNVKCPKTGYTSTTDTPHKVH